jgi:hypothetical protein
MSEWASRLIALEVALLPIFPRELLPIVNDYWKSRTHAWAHAKQFSSAQAKQSSSGGLVAAPDNAFVDVTDHVVRTDFHGDTFDVESKYSTEDGPCLWAIVCHIERYRTWD